MNADDTAVRKTPPRGRWVGSETKVRTVRTLTCERRVAMVFGAQSSPTVVGSEGLASPEAADGLDQEKRTSQGRGHGERLVVEGVPCLFQDRGKNLSSGPTDEVRGRWILTTVPKMLFIIQEP